MWRHRSKDFESKKEAPPSIEGVQQAAADPTGLTGLAAAAGYKYPTSPWLVESLSLFVFSSFFFFPTPAPG